jgi:hypothetical protein
VRKIGATQHTPDRLSLIRQQAARIARAKVGHYGGNGADNDSGGYTHVCSRSQQLFQIAFREALRQLMTKQA